MNVSCAAVLPEAPRFRPHRRRVAAAQSCLSLPLLFLSLSLFLPEPRSSYRSLRRSSLGSARTLTYRTWLSYQSCLTKYTGTPQAPKSRQCFFQFLRYPEVNRIGALHDHSGLLYEDRLSDDDLWLGEAPNVDAAVNAGLTDLDGHADVCCESRRSQGQPGGEQEFFHCGFPKLPGYRTTTCTALRRMSGWAELFIYIHADGNRGGSLHAGYGTARTTRVRHATLVP